ncbi:MAG: hypothetical protein ABEI52_00375 [Halobacteriaceae archaeon]
MSSSSPTPVWYTDPSVLVDVDALDRIFPSRDEDIAAQMNAIMRFALIFSLIVVVIRRDINALFIPVAVGALTFAIHESRARKVQHKEERLEKLDLAQQPDGKVCVRPTHDNPFMNVLVSDVADFPNRPPACPPTTRRVKEKIERNFSHNLYRDVDDVFERNSSSRQFYTMPSTTVPNDRETFARWLYHTGPTIKERNLVPP